MIEIIYEDKEMIVCRKSAGELSQGNKSFDVDLVSRVLNYRKSKNEDVYAAIINRLDRPVEGLVLFAKNRQTAAKLSEKMKNDTFNKKYYAVVQSVPKEKSGTLENYIYRNRLENRAVVINDNELLKYKKESPKKAVLDYEVVAVRNFGDKDYSMLRICLHTGRFHQIRAQLSHIGCPIAGDKKYGAGEGTELKSFMPPSGIALCAYSLDVEGRHIEIEPDNEIFQRFKE